jgi:hypothetical protein
MRITNCVTYLCLILSISSCTSNPFKNNEIDSLKKENKFLKQRIQSQEQTSYTPNSSGDQPGDSSVNLADFIDNTKKFKGKRISLVANFDDNLEGYSLRTEVGGVARFWASDDENAKASLLIHINKGLNVPNAVGNDELDIIFMCNTGELIRGNQAVLIARHNDNIPRNLVLSSNN